MARKVKVTGEVRDGSLLDNMIMPVSGMVVWARVGMMGESIVQGKILNYSDIDNRGLANIYVNVTGDDGVSYSAPVSRIFLHRPEYVEIEDCYGPVHVWR
jgi:hypothetical protein